MQVSGPGHCGLSSGFLAVWLVVGLVGCAPDPPSVELAWTRIDLWVNEPRIEMNRNSPSAGRPSSRRIVYLGPGEVWDREPSAPAVPLRRRWLYSSSVRARQQLARSRLAWEVELGEEAYFSFVPLSSSADCRFRVGVRDAQGGLKELLRYSGHEPTRQAPATLHVDLREYARERVELLLQIDPPASWQPGDDPVVAHWGSPAVYTGHPPAGPQTTSARPNVLLLGIDTLRASALGAYGRTPSVTPGLDLLASESDVWLEAFSSFNSTNPSFASLMSGLYGKNHGIYNHAVPLSQAHTTLAELFSAAGFETAAIVSVRHLAPDRSGLGQGFDSVTAAKRHFSAELAVDTAIDWLAKERQRPFFLWLHLFDPHTPHTPPEPYASGLRPSRPFGLEAATAWTAFRDPSPILEFRESRLGGHADLYIGEVAYLDHQLDRLFDFLRGRSLLESTIVALIADHGENLEEHGVRYRHAGLWDTTTHVPLMIRWPGPRRFGRRIAGLVQNIDLFPTLLSAVGIAPPSSDGIELRALTGRALPGRRRIFSESANRHGFMVRNRKHKLIRMKDHPFIENGDYLYDLDHDPEEIHNLTGQGLPAEEELAALALQWLAQARADLPAQTQRPLEPDELESLRALGYL